MIQCEPGGLLKEIEKIRVTSYGTDCKREFEPREQVFPELVFSC